MAQFSTAHPAGLTHWPPGGMWRSWRLLTLCCYVHIYLWPHHPACGFLVLQLEIEPGSWAVKALSPNHWTSREFQCCYAHLKLAKAISPITRPFYQTISTFSDTISISHYQPFITRSSRVVWVWKIKFTHSVIQLTMCWAHMVADSELSCKDSSIKEILGRVLSSLKIRGTSLSSDSPTMQWVSTIQVKNPVRTVKRVAPLVATLSLVIKFL